MITFEQFRRNLGAAAHDYTNDELLTLYQQTQMFIDICIELYQDGIVWPREDTSPQRALDERHADRTLELK